MSVRLVLKLILCVLTFHELLSEEAKHGNSEDFEKRLILFTFVSLCFRGRYTCVWACMPVYAGEGQRFLLGVVLCYSLPQFFETGSLTEPDAYWLASLTHQWPPGIFLSFPGGKIIRVYCPLLYLTFYIDVESLNSSASWLLQDAVMMHL